jgi:RNA recognition motif-containing protein
MDNKCYIGNLDYTATEADVQKLCEPFGKVYYVNIPTTEEKPRGFCFVKFSSELEADRCVSLLNGQDFMDRVLNVAIARPRPSPATAR